MQDGQFLLKLTLEMTILQINKIMRWRKNRVTFCIITHFFWRHLLNWRDQSLIKVLQNRKFPTDRDDTMTRHDFRPWFICVLNLKSLAQFLHTKLACTMYLTSGENVKTDNFQSVPESTIFNRSRLNFNETRLETSVYTIIKF